MQHRRSTAGRTTALVTAALALVAAGCGADDPSSGPGGAESAPMTDDGMTDDGMTDDDMTDDDMTDDDMTGTAMPEPSGTAGAAATVPEALDFTAPAVDGGTVDVRSLAGTPVVFWFWAPWCPVCRREAPLIAELADDFAGQVSFVGVAGLSSDRDAMTGFMADGGVEGFPHIDDSSGEVYSRFEVTQQYDLGVVTADGDVEVLRGPLTEDQIVDAVHDLAAG